MQNFYSEEPVKEVKTTEKGDSLMEEKFDLSEQIRKERAFAEAQLEKLYKTINATPVPVSEELKKAVLDANEHAEKWRAEHKPIDSVTLKKPQFLQAHENLQKKLPKT